MCVNFKKRMIYKLIELQNGYGYKKMYVLVPQCRIANCDDYITSNLFGIDLNSKFGKQDTSCFQHDGCFKRNRKFFSTSIRFFGEVCVVYMFNFQ